jgi:hypothetical protein
MRRDTQRAGLLGLTTLATLILAAPARAQEPAIPDMAERSGLIGRYIPKMQTNLPPDPHRDYFYGTRYGDFYTSGKYDRWRGGGLYGLMLDPGCTTCVQPQFTGAPGAPMANAPGCNPGPKSSFGILGQKFVHPFRPVGHYYQHGCMVPIYDLRPLAPGPGRDLWPWYINGHGG